MTQSHHDRSRGDANLVAGVHAAGLAALMLLVSATAVVAAVPTPTVEGPIGGGAPTILATNFDLAEVGYTQEEYFISGTATRYVSGNLSDPSGQWTVVPAGTAPYKTRLLVYRPAKFKGTVVVEWLNVAAGQDVAPEWVAAHA